MAIKEEFLRLLREDEEFRYAVAGILGLDSILRELKELREDFNKFIELENKRWEEANKRFEIIENELKQLRIDFNNTFASFDRRLIALGARWGIFSEQAFRDGMKGVVEKLLGTGKVERWIYRDESGEVYGYPSEVEVDILIKDHEHILIEIKSSISRGDVIEFWRKGKLYEKVTGIKPKLVIISPFVDDKALEDINRFGILLFKET